MKPSLITDEISADPETAFELGTEWGIHDYELRGYFTERIPLLTSYQKQRLRDMIADYGANIVAVSPGLFKIPYPSRQPERSSLGWMDRALYSGWADARAAVDYHLTELLPATLDYANEVGAKTVICFSFHRGLAPGGPAPEEVVESLSRASKCAGEAGLRLVVETEAGFWADTGARSADLARAVNQPAFGINWDPANSFSEGDDPYPTGYDAVKGFVRHVHFKDARRRPDGGVDFVLDGEIDWPGQIAALKSDGYNGFISVETHLRPRVAAARESLVRLRELIAGAATPATSP